MEQDHPWGALRRSVEMKAFEKHPYRFPVIGLSRDIRALTVEQMMEHYGRYYVPENAVLAVAGDLDPDFTLRTVERLFPHGASGVPSPPLPLSGDGGPRAGSGSTSGGGAGSPECWPPCPPPSVHQRDHDAFQILDRALSEGRLSRLYRKFVEETRLASRVPHRTGGHVRPLPPADPPGAARGRRPGSDRGTPLPGN